jgi:hypothetical protein
LHVGLEAFAKGLVEYERSKLPAPSRLVRDPIEWKSWVHRHTDELRAMAAGEKEATILVNKVMTSANRSSSDVVKEALSLLNPPLVVDERTLGELSLRNLPTHHFQINKKGVDYDVDREIERICILRCLLSALLSRACNYDGAIAGWATSDAREWKPAPEWWPLPSEQSKERARIIYAMPQEAIGDQEREHEAAVEPGLPPDPDEPPSASLSISTE